MKRSWLTILVATLLLWGPPALARTGSGNPAYDAPDGGSLGGSATADINLVGTYRLCLDADSNSCFYASADNVLRMLINNAIDFTLTANTFTVDTGSVIALPDGTSGAPSIAFTTEADLGPFRAGANEYRIVGGALGVRGAMSNNVFFYAGSAGTEYITWDSDATPALQQNGLTWGLAITGGTTKVYYDNSAQLRLASDFRLCISSGTDADSASCDISLVRESAGTFIVRDGTTGNGSLLAQTRAYTMNAGDITIGMDACGGTITNEGSTTTDVATLPSLSVAAASSGANTCQLTFIVQSEAANNNLTITRGGDDTINVGSTIVDQTSICLLLETDSVTLRSVNATQWYAVDTIGTITAGACP